MMKIDLRHGAALEVMGGMEADSIDLIVTDPPYFKVKNEWWDRQWDNAAAFLAWIGELCEQWHRILKPNGSLYVFASPKMARKVAGVIEQRFNILNEITWDKPPFSTKAEMFVKENLRTYFPASERIIFAEHYGADNIAKGEAGYATKCDELRGFVFEPLRAYLREEWARAGLTHRDMNKAVGSSLSGGGMASHYIGNTGQWALPTEEHYLSLRAYAQAYNHGGEYLQRDYEDLRRDYEDLRRDYEGLRRPFNATPNRPYTDVWTFPTVAHFPGKHPCEKPVALLEHIILTSSKPGAVVLDCFMGRGSTAKACANTGRDFIGCDVMEKWVKATERRLSEAERQPALF